MLRIDCTLIVPYIKTSLRKIKSNQHKLFEGFYFKLAHHDMIFKRTKLYHCYFNKCINSLKSIWLSADQTEIFSKYAVMQLRYFIILSFISPWKWMWPFQWLNINLLYLKIYITSFFLCSSSSGSLQEPEKLNGLQVTLIKKAFQWCLLNFSKCIYKTVHYSFQKSYFNCIHRAEFKY